MTATQTDPEQSLPTLTRLMQGPDVTSRELGRLGERYTQSWLEHQGWRLMSHNWRSRFGELDLVMLTPTVFWSLWKSRPDAAHGMEAPKKR